MYSVVLMEAKAWLLCRGSECSVPLASSSSWRCDSPLQTEHTSLLCCAHKSVPLVLLVRTQHIALGLVSYFHGSIHKYHQELNASFCQTPFNTQHTSQFQPETKQKEKVLKGMKGRDTLCSGALRSGI